MAAHRRQFCSLLFSDERERLSNQAGIFTFSGQRAKEVHSTPVETRLGQASCAAVSSTAVPLRQNAWLRLFKLNGTKKKAESEISLPLVALYINLENVQKWSDSSSDDICIAF